MPTVAREGQFRFVVNTRENQFEPPHVHVWVGNEDVCRIELNSGIFMEEPPPGEYRRILQVYARHAEAIRMAWDDIHRDNNREDDSATLLGLFNEADVGASTTAIDLVSTISSDRAGDAIYMGASAVQRIGALNTAIRLNASIPLDGDSPFVSGGVLPFLELSWTPHGSEDLVYINAFWGIDEFASAARGPDTGGPLGRTGILFEAVGLGQFGSALDNRADRVVGGAVGYQWFLDGARRQLIVEAGGRIDTSGDDGSAAAVGLRFQQAIGQRWIIQPNLFGALQERRDEAFGARLEISVKF